MIVAPTGRDAELIATQLARFGLQSGVASTDLDAVDMAANGLAGVIMTEEAVTAPGLLAWQRVIHSQPPWSDLPFLILGSFGGEWAQIQQIDRVRRALGNVTLLDRPLRARLLLSAVSSALRARHRQYEMRDAMIAQQETEHALRQSEKLAVAGRLAATISHEINNPLSAIANLLFLADSKSTDGDARVYLGMAQEELRRVSDIVRETLRFHRAPTQSESTVLADLLDSSLALFVHKMERHGITLEKRYPATVQAFCSPGEIRQALVNLIGNAIDAMSHGGRLTVSAKPLTTPRGRGVAIYVADTGGGIKPESRERLFEQFFTTKGTTGTGLGLWLTRDVVQRNRGRIRLRSCITPPTGTIFSIWLPCEAAKETQQTARSLTEIRAAA